MKLGTMRRNGRTHAVRIDASEVIEIEGFADAGELLRSPEWRSIATRADRVLCPLTDVGPRAWAPVIPRPGKIVCVGLNYRAHIVEMGHELPDAPTLFTKFPEALIGADDPIQVPPWASEAVDWEGELAFVIGRATRRADKADVADAIAGYAVFNDISMRDYQYRTMQWLAGKSFEGTTPFGPYLVTVDEFQHGAIMRCEVNGEVMQEAATDDLVFTPEHLVADISRIFPLAPGDVIATGTPHGVGHGRDPRRYLRPGDEVRTSIAGLGTQRNVVTTS